MKSKDPEYKRIRQEYQAAAMKLRTARRELRAELLSVFHEKMTSALYRIGSWLKRPFTRKTKVLENTSRQDLEECRKKLRQLDEQLSRGVTPNPAELLELMQLSTSLTGILEQEPELGPELVTLLDEASTILSRLWNNPVIDNLTY